VAAFGAGDVVVVDFPGVAGVKRRPAVVLSSDVYHAARPDVIVGLITSQTAGALGPTDYRLQDWAQAGLRLSSVFRSFIVTLPPTALQSVIGHLSARDWQSVRACVRTALEPLDSPAPQPSASP
jgi:mRNA-degrading endonuclease toxin of MazEF toxin-antitoxin module